jgi:hypothetical protein
MFIKDINDIPDSSIISSFFDRAEELKRTSRRNLELLPDHQDAPRPKHKLCNLFWRRLLWLSSPERRKGSWLPSVRRQLETELNTFPA